MTERVMMREGAKALYRNAGWDGWKRGTIVEADEEIKNGRPGYAIELDEPTTPGDPFTTQYWGYENQFRPAA